MKMKRLAAALCVALLLCLVFSQTAFAAGTGDVAGVIEGTWNTASQQIKTVVNKVVFPAIDLILAVFFFAKLGTAYFDYRKHGQFEWAAPAILFACLVFTLTAPYTSGRCWGCSGGKAMFYSSSGLSIRRSGVSSASIYISSHSCWAVRMI